jgi:type IV pilus assembly protein PilP
MMPTVRKSGAALVLSSMVLAGLTGCSSGHQDIQQWMDQERQKAPPHVTPIPRPIPFVPASYGHVQSTTPNPFGTERLSNVLKAQNASDNALLLAEQNRRREPLEAFPLDAMAMVGSIDKNGRQVALIKANNLIYQVRVGNHLGQDYGKVIRIMEDSLELREVVQDSSGAWIERNTAVQLKESQGK